MLSLTHTCSPQLSDLLHPTQSMTRTRTAQNKSLAAISFPAQSGSSMQAEDSTRNISFAMRLHIGVEL